MTQEVLKDILTKQTNISEEISKKLSKEDTTLLAAVHSTVFQSFDKNFTVSLESISIL
jgi:hypothetical protein